MTETTTAESQGPESGVSREHVHVWVHVRPAGGTPMLVCRCVCGETLTPEQIMEVRAAAGLEPEVPEMVGAEAKRAGIPRKEQWRRRQDAAAARRCVVSIEDRYGPVKRDGWYLGVNAKGLAVVGFDGVQNVRTFAPRFVKVGRSG